MISSVVVVETLWVGICQVPLQFLAVSFLMRKADESFLFENHERSHPLAVGAHVQFHSHEG